MFTEPYEILTEQDFLNEFDDIVEAHCGIARDIWKNSELKKEIDALPDKVEFEELSDGNIKLNNGDIVRDLRHLDFITVDPKDCRDMDDAVCCDIDENGDYVLYTAIADVQRYFDLPQTLDEMSDMDSLGKVYLAGGYTMYSSFKAYGILPSKLCDELCSLKENENRLAFVTKIVIDSKTGSPKGEPEIMEGLIRNRAKLSYNEAQRIVDSNLKFITDEKVLSKNIYKQVLLARVVADLVIKGFEKRGMIKFPSEKKTSVKIVNGKLKVETIERLPYRDVIEYLMILTNEANAQFAHDHNLNVIYRTHDAPTSNPDTQDISALIKLLKIMPLYGFEEDIESPYEFTPSTFNRIFEIVKNGCGAKHEIYRRFLSKIQLRAKSDMNAKQISYCDYISGTECSYSHFRLQSKYYMHITSPIRRITDYVNMRNILAYVNGKEPLPKTLVGDVARHADERRVEVDKAEDEFKQIVACRYYENFHLPVSATICDFDYSKNGYCVFRDEQTGFKINVPIEEFSHGLYVDREKWGFQICDSVVACLGQKAVLLVDVKDNSLINGSVINSNVRVKNAENDKRRSPARLYAPLHKNGFTQKVAHFNKVYDEDERE